MYIPPGIDRADLAALGYQVIPIGEGGPILSGTIIERFTTKPVATTVAHAGICRSATRRSRRRAQLLNLSQALLQALKLRKDLRFHGVL